MLLSLVVCLSHQDLRVEVYQNFQTDKLEGVVTQLLFRPVVLALLLQPSTLAEGVRQEVVAERTSIIVVVVCVRSTVCDTLPVSPSCQKVAHFTKHSGTFVLSPWHSFC